MADTAETRRTGTPHASQSVWDAATAVIDRTGVGPGWRCLLIGSDLEGLAHWLTERVTPGGVVTLSGRARDHRAEQPLDLVHVHLTLGEPGHRSPELRRLVDDLRPGGWLTAAELDWTGLTEKRAGVHPVVRRLSEAMMRLVQSIGGDAALGRELPALFRSLGLQGTAAARYAADPAVVALALHRLGDLLIGADLATEDDVALGLAELRRLSTPGGPEFVTAVGRKPAAFLEA